MAGGVRAAARWSAVLALVFGAPIALPMMLVWADHTWSFWPQRGWTAWLPLLLIWAVGVLGSHLLPFRPSTRIIIAILYSPAAAGLMFVTVIFAACGWYGECP